MHPFLFLLAFLATAASGFAKEGRLPEGVTPLRYAIRLEPDIEKQTFSGRVEIEIELKAPARELVLNSLGLRITSAKAGPAVLQAKADDAAQQLTLSGSELPAGRHVVSLEFSGTLNERPQGLYLTRYQLPDGTWQKALVTQMEPADARRMFPCWDEPAYRSIFALTAVVPANHTAISNMPAIRETVLDGGKKEWSFAPSLSMSSYLVAFASAELEVLEDEIEGVKLRIFATPGKRDKMRYAMESTKKVLPWFNEYFGVKYPLPKLDQVSFPSVAAGGMENWGCIIYADHALLFDEKQSSQSTRERVFDIVAHEIAHQWFGDLVTMEWWDNLWLNEGFASWMATKVSDHFNPAWKKWERAAGGKESAMRLDARSTTHPIQQEVVTAGQAMQVFDEITYQKGQAFLRMLETWIGEEKFRDGLRHYFAMHAYSNTTTSQLWEALTLKSGERVDIVARGWTEQPGFPIITVKAAGEGKLELSQSRFTIHQKDAKPLRWQIPVTLRPLAPGGKSRTVLLGAEPERVVVDSLPVLVNAGAAGYFRVRYEGEAQAGLVSQFAGLPEIDQVNVLNDTWALVQAGTAPLSDWLDLARLCQSGRSALVTSHLVSVLGSLNHLVEGAPEQAMLHRWGRDFLAPQWQRLGWDAAKDEDFATAYLRAELIETLGIFGDARILVEARAKALQFLESPASLPANLRAPVLRLTGRGADAAMWTRIHTLAKANTDTEQKYLLYGALASAQLPELAQRALAISLSGELPSKTAARMVGRVASEGNHPDLAWAFAKDKMHDLLALCSAGDASEFMARIARSSTNPDRAAELEALTKSSLPPDAAYDAAIAADDIRFKASFRERLLPAISKAMALSSGGGR